MPTNKAIVFQMAKQLPGACVLDGNWGQERMAIAVPKGRDSALFGRVESVSPEYRARFAAHGERIARAATKLGWTITVHRTDHSPQAALIALHAAHV